MTTGTDIAKRIEASKALTPKERRANREAVKDLAAVHMMAAVKKLSEIVADKNAPASAKVAAATQLLDRVAGKPKQPLDEKESDQLERLNDMQVLQYICDIIRACRHPQEQPWRKASSQRNGAA